MSRLAISMRSIRTSAGSSRLANILSRNLADHLRKWVEGGQYGALFDNVEDNLTFAAFQTFDFEGLDKYPQVLEPLLFYVLHRANASIYDPALDTRFKVFVMDEAWRFLKNDTIRQYITEAVKTWRKRNAAMILATQSSDDLERSRNAERHRRKLRDQDVSRQSRHGPECLPRNLSSQ